MFHWQLRFNKYIFIHPDSEISDVRTGSNASKAIRIALSINDGVPILLCNAGSSTSTKSWNAALTNANGKTVYKTNSNGSIQYDNGKPIYNTEAVNSTYAYDLHYYNGGRTSGTDYNFNVNRDLMLCEVGSGSTTKINLKIWLEGGDDYCVETIAGEAIKLVLKFDSIDVAK